MIETFRAAHAHQGAAFVEIFQNCNVFNDGAFEDMTGQGASRTDMLIPLDDGQPIRFGADGHRGRGHGPDGQLRIVDVADVGEDALLVHDAHRDDPSLAIALARLSTDDHSPTPIGVFRAVERPDYGTAIARQLMAASERKGSPATSPRCCAPTAPGRSADRGAASASPARCAAWA